MSDHPTAICVRCGVSILSDTDTIGSSTVHELLNSNMSPSTDTQVAAARQALRSLENEIASLDEKISQMRDAMERMQERRSALHDHAAAHKGLVSSLRRFPAEILSEIFLHSLPAFPRAMSEDQAPLLLDRVCRRWKDVSRSTPALWSYIAVNLWEDEEDFDLWIVSICLARAGNHPLMISLGSNTRTISLSGLSRVVKLDHPALALLVAQCELWHTVYLQMPLSVLLSLSKIRGRLASLHKLRIFTDTAEDDEAIVAFADAPRLRRFDARTNFFRDPATKKLHLPWGSLTNLTIDERDAGTTWAILQDCLNLVDLKANIGCRGQGGRLGLPDLILSHLRSLTIKLPESSNVLSTLTLPRLKHATFMISEGSRRDGEDGDISAVWHVRSGLSAMLLQSRCELLELKLRDEVNIFQSEDLIACLEALPSLTRLDVGDSISNILPQSLADLSRNGGAKTPLAPQLKTLMLDARNMSFPWHLLPDFLRSRRVNGGRFEVLRRLRLRVKEAGASAAGVPDFVQDTLRTLQLDGMNTEVVNERGLVDWL